MIYLWTRENDSLIRDEKNLLRKGREKEVQEFISQSPSPTKKIVCMCISHT